MSKYMGDETSKIKVYHGATEICLLNQSLTDKYLEYDGTESAE